MDSFENELFKIAQAHNPNITPEQFSKWEQSHQHWASQNYKNSARWIDQTVTFLDKNLDDIDVEKFLINTRGLIVDLPTFVREKIGIAKLLEFKSIQEFKRFIITKVNDLGMKIHLIKLIELHETISKFQSSFSNEDIFAVTYFRNTYCHPVLDKYSGKIEKNDAGVFKFNTAKYVSFLKIQPYAEIDLCKSLYEKLTSERETLNQMRKLFMELGN